MEDVDKDFMYQRNLYLPLVVKVMKLKKMSHTNWEVLDKKAQGTIKLSLSSSDTSIFPKIKPLKISDPCTNI